MPHNELFYFNKLHSDAAFPMVSLLNNGRDMGGDAIFDVFTYFESRTPLFLYPGARIAVGFGLKFVPPASQSFALELTRDDSIEMLPGSSHLTNENELVAYLVNNGSQPYCLQHNDQIAWLILKGALPSQLVEG
jgi:hypothetical protein